MTPDYGRRRMRHVLIATDSEALRDEITGALGGPDTRFSVVREGKHVVPAVVDAATPVDVAVLDLQIGNMGGMAACMALHLEASGGRCPETKVVMLLDRTPDVFLARRSQADGWLVKPLDSFRLRKAINAVLDGGIWHEGVPVPAVVDEPAIVEEREPAAG
jgi:DNA-binding NarL/FixJ family response regulator